MEKITIEDLNNWVDKNGEHPIIDGPYCGGDFNKNFIKVFREKFDSKLINALLEYHDLNNIDELDEEHFCVDLDELVEYTNYKSTYSYEEFDDFISQKFVETLNELNYENKFL